MRPPSCPDLIKAELAKHPDGLTITELKRRLNSKFTDQALYKCLRTLQQRQQVTATFEPCIYRKTALKPVNRQRHRYTLPPLAPQQEASH